MKEIHGEDGMEARKGEGQASHTHLETEHSTVGGMFDQRVEIHNMKWRKRVGRRVECRRLVYGPGKVATPCWV